MPLIAILFLFLSSCQTPPTNKQVGIIAGSTIVAKEVAEKIKEASELAPYITISPIEVCTLKTKDTLECILTPCEQIKENDCKRSLPLESINKNKTAFIKREGLIRLFSYIKATCQSEQKDFRKVCKMVYKNYTDIDKLFIYE